MSLHFFHCTDGTDLILDREGRQAAGPREAFSQAHEVADALMRAVPAYGDWENWSVHIYDEVGAFEIVPFRTELRQAA